MLDSIKAKNPMKNIPAVRGESNAKVVPDSYQQWAGTVGRFWHWRGLDFAKSHRLTLANTLNPDKLSRTATRHAPDGRVHNQTYFILTFNASSPAATNSNTRSIPGANIGSDHDLVLTTIEAENQVLHEEPSHPI